MDLVRTRPGAVWRITLARPDVGNAVSAPMLGELSRALEEAAGDGGARVVWLAGEGRHFCAGADIDELHLASGVDGGADYGRSLEGVLRAIEEHPLPVIGVIHGAALGAGCQLAVACDLAVVADDSRLGIPSSRLGVVIGYENVARLVLAIGPKRAGAMLLGGQVLTGTEAVAWGLVNEAVPADELARRADELADAIVAGAPISVRASKLGIRRALEYVSIDRASEGHRVAEFDQLVARALASDDLKEGIQAFRERREPEFKGH
ncbi:MAG TPA: enoyl-CoA hydratase-related protein [Actinomycetota bacterium]